MSSGFSIDLVEIIFTLFWIFFFALVFWLHREGKREGYPLVYEGNDELRREGFPKMPKPKEYLLEHGGTVMAPREEAPEIDIPAEPAHRAPGSPYVPTGDPIGSNIGTGAWTESRSDTPILTPDGHPRIVPMRVDPELHIDAQDTDPRGLPLLGADDVEVGKVKDAWIDLAEPQIYYLEVQTDTRSLLVPFNFASYQSGGTQFKVNALYSHQFANVPALKSPDQISALEEDKICAYFGGGLLYADEQRVEPWL